MNLSMWKSHHSWVTFKDNFETVENLIRSVFYIENIISHITPGITSTISMISTTQLLYHIISEFNAEASESLYILPVSNPQELTLFSEAALTLWLYGEKLNNCNEALDCLWAFASIHEIERAVSSS